MKLMGFGLLGSFVLLQQSGKKTKLELALQEGKTKRASHDIYKISWAHQSRWRVCMRAQSFRHVRLFVTLWTVACQTPLSTGFSRQECWSGLPFPPPVYLPDPRSNPRLLCLQHWRQILYHWATWEAHSVGGARVCLGKGYKTKETTNGWIKAPH